MALIGFGVKNKQKISARNAVNNAVRKGILSPIKENSCSDCGDRPAFCYHHDSYKPEDWLDVRPLCIFCHQAVHQDDYEAYKEHRRTT